MPFYAVAAGKVPGVYQTWEECLNQTKGYPKAKFKKFNTQVEALKFVKEKGSAQQGIAHNSTDSLIGPIAIENVKPPELKPLGKYSSQTLLKQDKLSLIAEKLDNFIEQTNKKLTEFSKRLDILETSIFSRNISKGKRKGDSSGEVKESGTQSRTKRRKTLENAKASTDDSEDSSKEAEGKSQTSNGTAEEVDGPWGGYRSGGILSSVSPQDFIIDQDGFVVVYTDGACSNNGRHGAKAGIGVWFNHNNPFNVAAPVIGNATNNNAEIQAATRSIEQASLAGIRRLNIHTDSQFMINCMTGWIKRWKKNNWVTSNGGPVKNKEQLVILDSAIQTMEAIKWTHIRGHMGNEGNECADALARNGATMY